MNEIAETPEIFTDGTYDAYVKEIKNLIDAGLLKTPVQEVEEKIAKEKELQFKRFSLFINRITYGFLMLQKKPGTHFGFTCSFPRCHNASRELDK